MINRDLTLEICSEDGSQTRFYQNDEDGIHKILGLLNTPWLFTQPFVTLTSERSVSTVPSQTIDLILVRVPAPPPLLLPPGWLDSIEVDAEAFLAENPLHLNCHADGEAPTAGVEGTTSYAEIHTIGDWIIRLRLQTADQAPVGHQPQFLAGLFDLPVVPFRLDSSGVGFINPKKITRATVYPGVKPEVETALPADLLRCVRA